MKTKIITILVIMSMLFATTCMPTFASSKQNKYIKVKRSTYYELKKENKKLTRENIELNNMLDSYWQENTNLKEELAEKESVSNFNSKIEKRNRQTILSEREIDCIDYMALVDSYEKGKWYCYYICADGDCYTVTIKNGHVDMFVQLN
jgi:hypothetical protein